MRLLVCGSRYAPYRAQTWRALDRRHEEIDVLIVGEATGVDAFARQWAKQKGVPCLVMPAAWDAFGKAAGPIRNGWMLKFCKPSRVLAMPGGRGTANMVKQAREAGIPVTRVGWKK